MCQVTCPSKQKFFIMQAACEHYISIMHVVCMNICVHMHKVQSSSRCSCKVLTLCACFACIAAAAGGAYQPVEADSDHHQMCPPHLCSCSVAGAETAAGGMEGKSKRLLCITIFISIIISVILFLRALLDLTDIF